MSSIKHTITIELEIEDDLMERIITNKIRSSYMNRYCNCGCKACQDTVWEYREKSRIDLLKAFVEDAIYDASLEQDLPMNIDIKS